MDKPIIKTMKGGSVCVINKANIILRSACGVWLHPAVVVVSWSESETRGCQAGILSGRRYSDIDLLYVVSDLGKTSIEKKRFF